MSLLTTERTRKCPHCDDPSAVRFAQTERSDTVLYRCVSPACGKLHRGPAPMAWEASAKRGRAA